MLWIFVFLQKPVAAVQQYPCRNLTAEPEAFEWVVYVWLGPLNVLCLNKRSLTSEGFVILLCCSAVISMAASIRWRSNHSHC